MKNLRKCALLTLASFGSYAHAQEQAPPPTPAGVVTVAKNATLGVGSVNPGATVFSGDLVKTSEEGRVNVQSGSVQFGLGPASAVRIFRYANRTVVEVERGTFAYSAKGSNEDLTFFALDIRLVPKTNVPASGQISIVSRCDVHVMAVHSSVEVTSGKESRTIEQGKSFQALSEFGVDYRDSWRPVLADYPDNARDAEYHHSHAHTACPAGVWQTASRSPVGALATGHFIEIVGGGVGILTGIVIHEALESEDRP